MLLGRPPRLDPPPACQLASFPTVTGMASASRGSHHSCGPSCSGLAHRSRQAATHHELADEVGEESAPPLRRAEPLPVEGVDLARGGRDAVQSLSRSRTCSYAGRSPCDPVGRAGRVPECGRSQVPRSGPAPGESAAAVAEVDRNRRGPAARPATSPPTAAPGIGPRGGSPGRRPVAARHLRLVPSPLQPLFQCLSRRARSRWTSSMARQLNSRAAGSKARRTCCATRSSTAAALRPKHACSVPSWRCRTQL